MLKIFFGDAFPLGPPEIRSNVSFPLSNWADRDRHVYMRIYLSRDLAYVSLAE